MGAARDLGVQRRAGAARRAGRAPPAGPARRRACWRAACPRRPRGRCSARPAGRRSPHPGTRRPRSGPDASAGPGGPGRAAPTSPAPSTLDVRACSATTCGCAGRSSAASSTTTIRSSRGTRASSVAEQRGLAVPVPPVTRYASRAATTAASSSAPPAGKVPAATSSASVNGRRRNVRSDRYGPPVATGGSTACSRVPSGSRASTQGCASSSRRPLAGGESLGQPPDRLGRARSTPGRAAVPAPRSTHTSDAVDQYVGDLGRGEQRCQRPGADQVRRGPGRRPAAGGVAERGRGRLTAAPPPPPRPGWPDARRPPGGPAPGDTSRAAAHAARRSPAAAGAHHSVTRRRHKAASGPRPVAAGAARAPAWPADRPPGGACRPAAAAASRPISSPVSRPGAGRAPPTAGRRSRCRPGRPSGRRGGGAQLRRHDQQPWSAACRATTAAVVEEPGQVDHDEIPGAAAGVERGRHRLAAGPRTVRRRSNDSTARSPRAGRAPDQRRRVQPAAAARELGPAQPAVLLPAEHQVEPAAQRVSVDEQGRGAKGGRGHGQPGRQHAGAGPATATQHRHHRCRVGRWSAGIPASRSTSHGSAAGRQAT